MGFKKIIKYTKIFFRFPLHLIYIFSCFSPRNKNIWIFGSGAYGDKFADNSKYLFLYVNENHRDKIRSIWISQKKSIVKILKENGYEAYHSNNPKAIFYSLKAKFFIIDIFSSTFGLCYWFSGRAKKINLWHGMPLKKIGYDDNKSIMHCPNLIKRFFFRIFIPWSVEKWNMVIVTSNLFREIINNALRVNKDKIKITGLPRNDIFFRKIKGSLMGMAKNSLIYNDLVRFKKKNSQIKVFFYAPTFRDTDRDFIEDANLDFGRIDQLLKLYNSFLIVKFHPLTKIKINKVNFDKIIFLNSDIDIYPFLSFTDFLITDYSSVYFDFLLRNKPIIFFPFDIKEYQTKDREFYFNYDEFTPGPKAYSFKELIVWMEYFLKGNDEFEKERKKIKNICFEYKDGNSSERIYQYLISYCN
ncbi:MAG: CDP-glycerol glycerophosphotransferase family protein [Candidatus Helarchaeota archaeon]